MSTENEQQEEKQFDSMESAFFDGIEGDQNQNQNQETDEELQEKQRIADEEASAQAEKDRLQQESDAAANKEAEEQRLAKEKEQQEQDKPKRWDENLNDQGKFILDKLSKGEEKEVYQLLRNKFGFENLNEEEKMLQYLAEKNPHLDRDDLLFKAESEYGIGLTDIDEEDLTSEQKTFLRRQEIERKGLLSEADKYFKEKAVDLTIPSLPNPLEEDEGYKEYLKAKEEQVVILEQQRIEKENTDKLIEQTAQDIINTAKVIDSLPIEMEIDLDQGKFDLKSDFKLDDAKKKELADYANEYFPTQAELKMHQDQNGKLDMKGYMTMLAKRLFSEQMTKAAIKQAISKDRDRFTDEELKNSTLRNNDNMHHSNDPKFDIYVDAMGK